MKNTSDNFNISAVMVYPVPIYPDTRLHPNLSSKYDVLQLV